MDDAGDLVSVAGGDGLLHLWHTTGSGGAVEVGSVPASDPTIVGSGVSPDGHTALVITSAGVSWWDVSNPAHPVSGGTSALAGADADHAPSPGDSNLGNARYSGNTFIATTSTGVGCGCATLGLWDVSAGHVRASSTLSSTVGDAVGLSSDGHMVAASGASNDTLTLWDTSDPRHPRTLSSVRTVKDLVWIEPDPADHLLADVGDKALELWDIRNPAAPVRMATLPLQIGLTDIAITPGGLVVPDGNSISLYDTDPAELANRLCSYTGSSITAAQWQQYAPGIPYRKPCP